MSFPCKAEGGEDCTESASAGTASFLPRIAPNAVWQSLPFLFETSKRTDKLITDLHKRLFDYTLYDRRGYNPEKSARFFASYEKMNVSSSMWIYVKMY